MESLADKVMGKVYHRDYDPNLIVIVERCSEGISHLHLFKRGYTTCLKLEGFYQRLLKRWHSKWKTDQAYMVGYDRFDFCCGERTHITPEIIEWDSCDEFFKSIGYDHKDRRVGQLDRILREGGKRYASD